MDYRVALRVHASLGEGLHWDGARSMLWMVDIHGRRLLRWRLDAPEWDEWQMPQRIGWVLPEASMGTALVGLQEGIARVEGDHPSQLREWLVRPFGADASMRLNDAKRDSTGAIWCGSLDNDDESRSAGSLYRLGPDRSWTVVDSGYMVANGPAISPDERTLLHTDSPRKTIFAFDLDTTSGQAVRRRVWKSFDSSEGYPDGMTFDAQGTVWIAHWGAGCVSRFDSSGKLIRRFHLPASQITNVCFCGAGRDRLFVSSASVGLDAAQREQQTQAGSLFEILHIDGATGIQEVLPHHPS
ncbi:MAG: SMP-30/gluconolactonase/LRE family protein [Vitreoscilla sp.]|nr:SMP-30/gluconolactonase/LRE family protein [Vitreoscilla sp.]